MRIALLCLLPWLASGQPEPNPCAAATWTADLARDAGERATLRVEGSVFRPDGQTPAAGIFMYVYQTGRDGEYGSDGHGAPRLRAWLRTDPSGRYRFDTIMPAPYPDRSTPAHIHVQFWGEKAPPQFFDLYFEQDPLLTKALRARLRRSGQLSAIVRPQPGGPGHTARQDFRLRPRPDRFEDSIRHGLERCR